MNNKTKMMAVSALALQMMNASLIPANASTDVKIETKATTVDVTVPSSIEFIFNEDGTNTLPTNFNITNNSEIARVSLMKAQLDAQSSGWRLLPESADTKTLAVNTKDIQFYMGLEGNEKLMNPGENVAATGEIEWSKGDITIDSKATQNISFDVNRGAFSTAESSAKAYDLVLTFEFN